MTNTFAITGMGRSGTKFLSNVLNQPPFTVKHEPVPGFRPVVEVQNRFDRQDFYGEVNSYLRFQLLALDVDYRAVILRDPRDIFQSMYNRGKPKLDHLNDSLYALDGLVRAGVPVISFSCMTQDQRYLQKVLEDIWPEFKLPPFLSPTNCSSHRLYMPKDLRANSNTKLQWFIDLYEEWF